MNPAINDKVEELARLINQSENLVVFSGAGMSTESGIPDYRSPAGVWNWRPPPLYNDFLNSSQARRDYWLFYKDFFPIFTRARPNHGHLALGRLNKQGRLRAVITQNIDGLHLAGGVAPDKILELHGNVFITACVGCQKHEENTDSVLKRFLLGEEDPACPLCGAPLKPRTISFGQSLDQNVLERAAELCSRADLLLVVGSSLLVTPAAELPRLTLTAGGKMVIINKEPTPLDGEAALLIRKPAGSMMKSATDLLNL